MSYFVLRVPLVLIRWDKMTANETVTGPLSPGAAPTVSPGGSITEALAGSHPVPSKGVEVLDGYRVYNIPPVSASGTKPDFEFRPVVDGTDYGDLGNGPMLINGHADFNMAPWPATVDGGPYDADGELIGGLEIGKSLLRLADYDPTLPVAGQKLPNNMATKATGLKSTTSLTLRGISQAGWDFTTAGVYDPTKGTPAVSMIYGDIWTTDIAAALRARWNAAIHVAYLERQLAGKAQLVDISSSVSAIDFTKWQQLPGGPKQKANKIFRRVMWTRNGIATTASTAFELTQSTSPFHGGETNVADQFHDLGFEFRGEGEAFILQQLGLRLDTTLFVGQATLPKFYFGAKVGGTQVPDQTMYPSGLRIDPFQNLSQFGSAYPTDSDPMHQLVLPRYPGRLMVYGENTDWYIQDDGTPLPAGSVYVAVAGPYLSDIPIPA